MNPSIPSTEKGFKGLRVVSFESRRSDQMADLITRNGGQAIIAPSMREIPLEQNTEAFSFAEKLVKGQIDAVIFMTGVGTRTLFEALETRYTRPVLLEALAKIKTFARGPKPTTVLGEYGLKPTAIAPEPNTWKELLALVDQHGSVQGKVIAIQEYGVTNKELLEGLLKRGARILRVPVYRWALPEDTEPLRQALHAIAQGQADIVLFTNGNQINHVMQLAQEEGIEAELRQALSRMVVASVGPTCTQFMDEYGLPVDVEPEHPKMGNLVLETSRRGPALLARKRNGVSEYRGIGENTNTPTPQHPDTPIPRHPDVLTNSPFLKACRCEPTSYTPIWLMRQAGRYMKEYRDIRERHSFLDLCKDPDLAAEVTVYAVQRLGVDAAIIFSDILLILEPMGLQLEYAKGDGPIIHNPVRTAADIEKLRVPETPNALGVVMDAIRKARQDLPPHIPLIGFSGAPFTLASYMIEGMGSRNYTYTKSLMYQEPQTWDRLMQKIVRSLIQYLQGQIEAGAQAIQLFDSWVGCLSPADYRQYVLPYTKQVIDGLRQWPTPARVPILHFGTDTGNLLEAMKEAGGDVIGIDWRVPLDQAWKRLGNVAIQGNLDPAALFASETEIRRQAQRILDQAGGRPGHIFNLGHGVLPNTPVGHAKALVDAVHELSQKRGM